LEREGGFTKSRVRETREDFGGTIRPDPEGRRKLRASLPIKMTFAATSAEKWNCGLM